VPVHPVSSGPTARTPRLTVTTWSTRTRAGKGSLASSEPCRFTVIPGHGRPWPVPNAGAHTWKACWGNPQEFESQTIVPRGAHPAHTTKAALKVPCSRFEPADALFTEAAAIEGFELQLDTARIVLEAFAGMVRDRVFDVGELEQIGGSARVSQEQDQSWKVTLDLIAMQRNA